jgi:hypothetical protein
VRFVERDLAFYARQALAIRDAGRRPVEGLEPIYFNAEREFTERATATMSRFHSSIVAYTKAAVAATVPE